MGTPRLVIFDCDGVLVDSEALSCGVLARMLTQQGLPTTLVAARREYQGLLLKEVASKAEAKLGRSLPHDWLATFEQRRAEVFRRELRPMQGAREAVEEVIAAGLAACVASQGKLSKTRLSLELTGLRPLFTEQTLFSAEQVPRGKPHPDLFLYAARTMGFASTDCVVVEDTSSGVRAAVSAGMRVLGFAADSDETALQDAGAQTFDSLAELPGLLRSEL